MGISHLGIYRNEIADKLAKKGLLRRKIQFSYTSLSYIGRLAREKILEQWKNNWQQNKNKGKHYTRICKGSYSFSLKAPKIKYPKKLQSAFFQLKLGKGYFKSFSKTIGKDNNNDSLINVWYRSYLAHADYSVAGGKTYSLHKENPAVGGGKTL